MEWLAPAESGAEAYSSYEWYIDEPNSPVWSTDGSTDGEADGLPPPSALAPQVQSFHEKPQLQSQPWTLTHGGGSRDKYDHIDWGRTWAIDACRSTAEPVVRAGPVASAVPAPAFHPSAFFVPRYQVEVAGPRRGPAQVKTEDYTTPGATSGGPALHHGILSAAPPSQPSLTGGATDASFEPETRASESVPAARASSALMSTKKRSHHAAWSRSSQLSGAVNKHPKINAETSSFQALVQAATKRFSRVRASNSKYSSDAYDVSTSATDDSIDGDTKPPMIRPFPPLSRATLSLSKLDLSIAKIVLSGEGRILNVEEAAFVLAAGRDAGINATASCGGTRPLTETPAWRLFVEPVNLSRPCRPTQSNDQWRNSGGASGATELLTEDGAIVVRRYGLVRRRIEGDKLRYHEYSFKVKGQADVRLFHSMPGRCTREVV